MRSGIETLRAAGFVCYHSAFLGVLADGLRCDGQLDQAAATLDEALATCERTGEAWCLPELLAPARRGAARQGPARRG